MVETKVAVTCPYCYSRCFWTLDVCEDTGLTDEKGKCPICGGSSALLILTFANPDIRVLNEYKKRIKQALGSGKINYDY